MFFVSIDWVSCHLPSSGVTSDCWVTLDKYDLTKTNVFYQSIQRNTNIVNTSKLPLDQSSLKVINHHCWISLVFVGDPESKQSSFKIGPLIHRWYIPMPHGRLPWIFFWVCMLVSLLYFLRSKVISLIFH